MWLTTLSSILKRKRSVREGDFDARQKILKDTLKGKADGNRAYPPTRQAFLQV